MTTNLYDHIFEVLPEEFLNGLKTIVNSPQCNLLEKKLEKMAIYIENDGYQLTIYSLQDLQNLREKLNNPVVAQ